MSASGLVLAAEAAVRVASLNLCTDEQLLLLAQPGEIVSVSHLSQEPRETALWRQARRYPVNDGSLESVMRHRPTLILSMGGSGRARAALAERLGVRLLDLPYPQSPGEVVMQARQVAAALGRPQAAEPFARKLAALERRRPALEQGAFLSGGGLSLSPEGLGGEWLRLAGFAQPRLAGGRLSLEQLATNPPKWLIRSDYRSDQASRGSAWLRHPLVTRLAGRTLATDGRPWTCGGLPMLDEVARLRGLRRR
ncbi:ABC transporter substrate-binding protein [Sphingomonas sp. LHG3406-1]|uniref:ABC transporter substrate-binding protein n=1 Tax=Sphingomonas sp. LHG3406-1 TaxID=2804617 RepID=UPI0026335C26|nr:ABC transporter substrate-binding protein [Sphingomonas sp. LHG3406-1]